MPSKDQERWKRLAASGAKREIPTPEDEARTSAAILEVAELLLKQHGKTPGRGVACGATMRFPGSLARTKHTETSGSALHGTGCESTTQTASSRCPVAEFSTPQWMDSIGIMPTHKAKQSHKVLVRKKPSRRSGQGSE